MFTAVKSLSKYVSSCVILNCKRTTSGLRQGCSLSPVLYTMINYDLVVYINALSKGINIDEDLLCKLCDMLIILC